MLAFVDLCCSGPEALFTKCCKQLLYIHQLQVNFVTSHSHVQPTFVNMPPESDQFRPVPFHTSDQLPIV